MFRLLIVSGKDSVETMFASMEGWESMGYRPPRVRKTTEDALQCMQKHHIDAIAIDDDPAFADLRAHLDAHCPTMPIFELADTPDKQLPIVKEVAQVLNRINADDSNDDYGTGYYFDQERNRWLHGLLSGNEPDERSLRKRYALYRCRIPLDQPCVYARFLLPEGDAYLAGPWHYGPERLETALYNFFGTEHEHMLIRIAVASPREVRALVAPEQDAPSDAPFTLERARDYLQDTVEQIDRYLGLRMKLEELRAVDSLLAFAANQHII